MITFKLEEEDRKVELSVDNEGLTLQECFMFWVDFAGGCGYTLDKVEMEALWAGDIDREKDISELALDALAADGQAQEAYQAQVIAEAKLAKAIEALKEVREFTETLYPFRDEQTVLVPRLAKALETLEELKKGQDDD